MIEIVLLRHFPTAGNLEGRYAGCRTDEPLCEGWQCPCQYPSVEKVYASPMRRCVETAKRIWPECSGRIELVPELRECDFGDFENKNYEELNGDPAYQAWVDSGGKLPFPNGESTEQFKARCLDGFARILKELSSRDEGCQETFRVGVVAHGGTVMAVLEAYGYPERDYFEYQVKNGRGYVLTPREGTRRWNYRCLP